VVHVGSIRVSGFAYLSPELFLVGSQHPRRFGSVSSLVRFLSSSILFEC
jgi:hypothetical protein